MKKPVKIATKNAMFVNKITVLNAYYVTTNSPIDTIVLSKIVTA